MNEEFVSQIKSLLGERFSTVKVVRENYSKGEDVFDPILPLGVVFPKTTEEVSKILKLCNSFSIPVVPFGAGTSLEGQVVGNDKGITISLENLNQILEVNPADFDCTVQAAVTRIKLNDHLKDQGVFFPIDPGADATIGGMCSTSASGTMAVKYGTMRTCTMGLKVVLPNGEIISTGGRAKKTSAGYNLTNLFIGSEGTLGVITEITLRLNPIPEEIVSGLCHFSSLEDAVQSVKEIVQMGIEIARVELLNKEQMEISINFSNLENLEVSPTLFFEFHGTKNTNKESVDQVQEICKSNNGIKFDYSSDLKKRNELWKARHDVYWSVKSLKPNARVYATDACVPISNLVECIKYAETSIKDFALKAPIVGHVGDGNFHVTVLYDPNNPEDLKNIRKFSDNLVNKTLSLGGTSTGEHGIGLNKKKYLKKEHESSLFLMKNIKKALDPNNIMNPGKIFDL
ncbi:MAG: FAD-binding protein [Candidatus Dadabacteria bacterium]|jgi:D-lactate dehydrogenase (cytochrome)|nr:FAD-binding protein [Candidatus Dadabacteria bacterium]|tara:strand:+ start:15401 stop:16771 length:1371 start_codon:yes stop_codon:yes gene_type:complete